MNMEHRYLWQAIKAGEYEVEKIDTRVPFNPKQVFEALRVGGISASQDGGCWEIVKTGDNQYTGQAMRYLYVVDEFKDQPLEYAALTAHRWSERYQ